MIQKFFHTAAIAGVALAGLAAVPASAQNYYGQDRYDQSGDFDNRYYNDDRRANAWQQERDRRFAIQQRRIEYNRWQRAQQNQAYGRGGYGQNYAYQNGYGQQRRCSSGTTGAVVGAVLGGLLGREVGRGGRFNEPSTTGAIIGAGGGALAGRAIERGGNCR